MGKYKRILMSYYINDNPNGIRKVFDALSPFDAYIIPRACISEASNVIEGKKIGVYFLFNDDKDKVYVGKTANGIGRIQTHRQKKDFWNIAIMFLADRDKWIPLIDELETYSIIYLTKSYNEGKSKYKLQNKNKLGKSEKNLTNLSLVESIFAEIKFWLATYDYIIDKPKGVSNKENNYSDVSVCATRGGIEARGLYNKDNGSIVVLKGSEIRYNKKYKYQNNVKTKLDEMFEKGCIEKKNGKYILKEDVAFDNLSPAAQFVIGGSCNGKIEWKSNGKTLKELFNL